MIDITAARRLALARAGLLKPEWTGLPKRATGRGHRARNAAYRIIRHFGYLQLDTVSIAGARSHAIVLLSRLGGFDHSLADEIIPCMLAGNNEKTYPGWIRPADFKLAARLKRLRPRTDRGILLSPFGPLLRDRRRVRQLFGFDQVLEIFKPAPKRIYGYYCLPVLAGDRLVGRVDLKADWKARKLAVLSVRFEEENTAAGADLKDREAVRTALERYGESLRLKLEGNNFIWGVPSATCFSALSPAV